MDQTTSDLIRALRLIMIMGLILVHFGNFPGETLSPFTGVVEPENFLASSFNSFFTYFFLSSVPVLSMISGYLFCYRGKPDFIASFKRKSQTLVAPSLFWTSMWFLFAYALFLASGYSDKIDFYADVFNELSILDFFNAIIGITDSPLAMQFWFIHDLALSILISPIIYPIIKRLSILPLIMLFTLWLFEWKPPIFFNLKVLTFFIVGIYLAVHKTPISLPEPNSIFLIFIPISIILTLIRIYTPIYFDGSMPYETMIELLLRITGSIAAVMITIQLNVLTPKVYRWCVNHSGYSFFLYAAHYPLVTYVKKALDMTGFFNGEGGMITLWIITTVLTVSVILLLAEAMNKLTPKVYYFLNGQRSI